ncbi:MAG: hypothetical protein HY238_09605 [Acidobacteria bacterium]|nr:hypothetical protein [Acidobacteriota bacterium]
MRKTSIAALGVACALAVASLAKVRIFGYWWENPLPYQTIPQGLSSLSAAQCGVCHLEIYQEWKASVHAHALSDRQFQAEMAKEPTAAWLCLNCHTPLENQLATVAVGVKNGSTHQPILKKNPGFDRALSEEGVTCAVCHLRDGVVMGPWGDSRAPHPVRKDPTLINEENCASCHQATARYTDILVCTFDTANEWRESSYAREGRSCTHCHMPAVKRPVAVGGPVRTSRRHLFFGSKIPKERLLSEAEWRSYDLYSSGLSVEIAGDKVVLKNAGAGHLLPTGDPERFILVKAELVDAAGRVVARRVHRIGQRWEWSPKARKLGDNRLKPLEERVLTLPANKDAVRVRVLVENWRISDQNAAYHKLGDDYPRFAVVIQTEKQLH